MSKSILVIGLVLAFSLNGKAADAYFNGKWTGLENGQMSLTQNGEFQGTVPCHEFRFDISQTENTFDIVDGYIWCGYAAEFSLGPAAFDLDGQTVLRYGDKVGSLINDQFIVKLGDQERYNNFEVIRNGDEIQYHHVSNDSLTLIEITGTLKRLE